MENDKRNNKKIKIILYEGKEIFIDDNSPSFDELISEVLKNKEKDFSNLSCECESENFDKEALENTLKETIKDFVGSLKIDNENFKKELDKLE